MERENIRVRVSETRSTILYYTSDIKIDRSIWDSTAQTIKARVLISPQDRSWYKRKIDDLKDACYKGFMELKESLEDMNSKNFSARVDKILYPERYNDNTLAIPLFEEFIKAMKGAEKTTMAYVTCGNILYRFECYMKKYYSKSFILTIECFNETIIAKFYDFCINEYKYMDVEAVADFFNNARRRHIDNVRNVNTANEYVIRLKAFFTWLQDNGYIKYNKLKNFKIGQEKSSSPIYLLPDEVKAIYCLELKPRSKIEKIRDLFVFQCMVGCRVSDLYTFTRDNIQNGFLSYIPKKTIHSKQKTIRVPLNNVARVILDKYSDYSRVLPTDIAVVTYNKNIKKIGAMANLNRKVSVVNACGEEEIKELKDVISTHTARKTFISMLINKGIAPQVIASMSGHSPNSRAFSRYYTIQDAIKEESVKILDI